MLERFLPRTEFSSYEDFRKNFAITVPARFNFAWDVVDCIAVEEPQRTALVWCNEGGEEATFSFSQMTEMSKRAQMDLVKEALGA